LLLLSRQNRQATQQNEVWLKGELGQLTPEYWRSQNINHIDYVFHLGAFIPKISAEANRIDRIVDDNISGTRTLLQNLPSKPDKLVFTSTIDVYAQFENADVLTESTKLAPNTLYGASKVFCESMIAAWAKECCCDYAILRFGHIYGPGEEQYGKLIPVVILNLLANQAPVVHGDGSVLRDYFYVGDAVEATIRAALVEGNVGSINIVRGESTSLKEIVQLLIRLVGSNKGIKFLSDKPNGKSLRFDNKQMTTLLGNWSMTSLAEGLEAEVEAFRKIENERK
jgi:nucleoside-diphosphate-sugar epimerase